MGQSPFFQITDIKIEGCQRLSKKEILELSGVDVHSNLVKISKARVQDLLEGKRKKNAQPIMHSVHEKLPLRGILQCSKCGKKLTGSGSKGNGGRFFYYHCSKGCKVRFRAEKANIEVSKLISKI